MKLEISERIYGVWLWLFVLAVPGFVLVPIVEESGMTGTHFQIGLPLPTLELKIGYLSPESPQGIHPFISLASLIFSLLNLVLWLSFFFGINRLVERVAIPDWILYPGIIIFFGISLVMNLLCGFMFLAALFMG